MLNINDEQAKSLIESFRLPPKPQILVDLQIEQARPEMDINAFADIISRDFAMSAAILKTINSPIFGMNRVITDIKLSVMMLGTSFISTFATQFQLKQALDGDFSISYEDFWDKALEMASTILMVQQSVEDICHCPAEDAYAFGMFRDCGMLLMARKYTDYPETLAQEHQSVERELTALEDALYSTNHAIVGFLLASSWHFPKPLCELILRHHEPDFLSAGDVSSQQRDLYAISKIAVNVLSQIHYDREHAEWTQTRDSVLRHFNLSDMDYSELEADIIDRYREING